MNNSRESFDLDEEIVKAVTDHWEARQKPLLLSELGNLKEGHVARRTKEVAENLRTYLRDQLQSRVDLIQHSFLPQVIGVVPTGIAPDNTDERDALLNRTRSKAQTASKWFQPAIWAAFRKPLAPTRRRFLSEKEPFEFKDVSESGAPDGFREIDQKFIAETDDNASAVVQNIETWLADHALESSLFLRSDDQKAPGFSNDLLGRLIQVLDTEELRRVSVPLDVVRKLRQTRL